MQIYGKTEGSIIDLLLLYLGILKCIALVQISTDDLFQAAQIEEKGLLDLKYRSPEMWKRVAFNEAVMAVVAVNFPDFRNIEFIRSLYSTLCLI